MDVFQNTHLILLDFDGLLVNTERLHFQAYQKMCEACGFSLPWDFVTFCSIAHRSSIGLKEKMYADLPELYASEPSWDVLYKEKKTEYIKLLSEGAVELMPGAGRFLLHLEQKKIKRAVVTNSPKEQVDLIKQQIPLLQTIPVWITREDYKNPKPEPDGYLKALAKLAEPGDNVLGFEDTLRGYSALESAEIEGIVVSDVLSDEFRSELLLKGARIATSFYELI